MRTMRPLQDRNEKAPRRGAFSCTQNKGPLHQYWVTYLVSKQSVKFLSSSSS